MKKVISDLLFSFLLFACIQVSAQVNVDTDISSGVKNGSLNYSPVFLPNNSAVSPYNSVDDTWSVNTPTDPPNVYNPVAVGSGARQQSTYVQFLNGNEKWISPFVNALGQHIKNAPVGDYYYRTILSITSCTLGQADIFVNFLYTDDNQAEIFVNGTSVVLFTMLSNSYASGPVGILSQLTQGTNTITIKVHNAQDWTGMAISASLQYITCAAIDFNLKDRNNNEKSQFCLDEDVFFNAVGQISGSYKLALLKQTGTGYSQLAVTPDQANAPHDINISDLFAGLMSAPFQPGNYQVTLTANTACGPLTLTKNFSIACCNNGADASFNLSVTNNGSVLKASSMAKGTSKWHIYQTPYVNTGPYTDAFTVFDKKDFLMDAGQFCYYVVHDVTNTCGTACAAESICNVNCDAGDCIIGAPANLHYNPATRQFSWDAVQGAVTYKIEIIANDASCCPGNPPVGNSSSHLEFSTDTNSYSMYNGPSEGAALATCFSWQVFAVCADGSKSIAAGPRCSSAN